MKSVVFESLSQCVFSSPVGGLSAPGGVPCGPGSQAAYLALKHFCVDVHNVCNVHTLTQFFVFRGLGSRIFELLVTRLPSICGLLQFYGGDTWGNGANLVNRRVLKPRD